MLHKTKTPLGKDGKPLKQSGRGVLGYLESLQLAYNANDELIKSIKIYQHGAEVTTTTTTYQYDAFGRRIAKQSNVKKASIVTPFNKKVLSKAQQFDKTEYKQIHYLWDGNRQLQEQTDTHVFTTIYEQNSFEPVARLVWLQDGLTESANDEVYDDKPTSNIQIYHYHNDHLGTPNELTNQDGEVVWLADYEAYGNTAKVVWREEQLGQLKVSAEELQPLRFQGQFIDQETGLHYNRFRYFDPDLGMFISRDPIGLMGGSNVFQYAPNPTGWIDPWGLQSSNNSINYKLLKDVAKKAAQLKLGKSVTVCSFKEADLVLFTAFPDAIKSAGAADKSAQKTSADKQAFKRNRQTPNGKASYHMDYKINPTTGVLYGHETLPNGHPHKTIPHINIVTPEGKRVDIFVNKCSNKKRK